MARNSGRIRQYGDKKDPVVDRSLRQESARRRLAPTLDVTMPRVTFPEITPQGIRAGDISRGDTTTHIGLPGPTVSRDASGRLIFGADLGGFSQSKNSLTSEKDPKSGARGGFWQDLMGLRDEVQSRARSLGSKSTKMRDPSQYNKTLEDFLAMAQQMLSGESSSILSGISAQEAALKRNAEEIRGTIGSGYRGLSTFIDGQAPKIEQGFQSGIEGSAAAAQRAQGAITEGSAAAQAQQQAIMERLGIQDANIPIANTGTTIEAEMARRIADSAQSQQGTENLLNTNKATELGFNTSMGTSAALEGQGQQDRIGRDLLSRLAALQDQRATASRSSTSDACGLAQQLMGTDYGLWSDNYDRRYNLDKDAMNYASAGQSTPELTSTGWGALGVPGQVQYMMQQSGVDPAISLTVIQALGDKIQTSRGTPTLQELLEVAMAAAGNDAAARVAAQNAALQYHESIK